MLPETPTERPNQSPDAPSLAVSAAASVHVVPEPVKIHALPLLLTDAGKFRAPGAPPMIVPLSIESEYPNASR